MLPGDVDPAPVALWRMFPADLRLMLIPETRTRCVSEVMRSV